MDNLSPSQRIAWAAGLFDGEGSVGTKWPARVQGVLEMQMVHKPTLDRFASIVGGTVKKNHEHRLGRRRQWRWRVYDKKAVLVAKILGPLCSEKRDQLEAFVWFKECHPDNREHWARQIKELKRFEFSE